MGQNSIGTEHILLGLVRDPDEHVAAVLDRAGADVGGMIAAVIRTAAGTPLAAGTDVYRLRCPSCGIQVVSVALTTIPSVGLVASYDGPVTCPGCGALYDLRYSIEWRAR